MAQTAIREPKVTLNMIPRDQTVGLENHRNLIVGQMLSGSASAGLVQDLPNTNAEINALFGARSHLAMLCRAYRSVNKYTAVDVIALADASGTNATAVLLVAGTATEAKTIYVDVVSSQNHSYEIDVEVGETEATFTAKLLAKVALDTQCPFTIAKSTDSATDDTSTFTSSHDGTVSNSWMIRIRDAFGRPVSVAGLTFTLTGWTGGATDPSLTSVLDPTENIRYHGVVWPSAYSTSVVKTWINARFNLDNDIKDGVVFQWVADTFANVKTAATAMNSPSFLMMTNEAMNTAYWKGPHLPESPDVIAVKFMAARARRFEADISISDLVVTNEFNDQFGGRHTCTLPYFNTPFQNVGQPERGAGYTYAERLELEGAGVSVIGQNLPNNAVIAAPMVTTYLNDTAGNEDDSWRWLNWRDTHAVIREFFVNNLREEFAQYRLTSGRAVSGYAIADEELIRAFCYQLYDDLSDEAITVAGRAARKVFEENLAVGIVADQRKVTLNMVVPMVSQLGLITGSIKFTFSV
jgi:phage tail sheath gpL-like